MSGPVPDPRVEAAARAMSDYQYVRDGYAPQSDEQWRTYWADPRMSRDIRAEIEAGLAAADAVDPCRERAVSTVEELDALPHLTVLRDAESWLWSNWHGEWQCGGSYGRPFPASKLVAELGWGPFAVLWTPAPGGA